MAVRIRHIFALKEIVTTQTPLGASPLLLVQGVVALMVLVTVGFAPMERVVVIYHVLTALAPAEVASFPTASLENVHMIHVLEAYVTMETVPVLVATKHVWGVYVSMDGVLMGNATTITMTTRHKDATVEYAHMEVVVVLESANMGHAKEEFANMVRVKRIIVSIVGIRR